MYTRFFRAFTHHIWMMGAVIAFGILAIFVSSLIWFQQTTHAAIVPVISTSTIAYNLSNGAGSVTSSIALAEDPGQAVTVYVIEEYVGIDIGTSTASSDLLPLHFDSSNWNEPQKITIDIAADAPAGVVSFDVIGFVLGGE